MITEINKFRQINEANETYKISINVESRNKEDIEKFLKLIDTIEILCSVGASREIKLDVDGDGSADLRFKITKGNFKIENDLDINSDMDNISINIGE